MYQRYIPCVLSLLTLERWSTFPFYGEQSHTTKCKDVGKNIILHNSLHVLCERKAWDKGFTFVDLFWEITRLSMSKCSLFLLFVFRHCSHHQVTWWVCVAWESTLLDQTFFCSKFVSCGTAVRELQWITYAIKTKLANYILERFNWNSPPLRHINWAWNL